MIPTLLRDHRVEEERAVTKVELFFDLVYVFAIIQLSHHLLGHLTGRGALETLILFLAVWWAWNYTAWAMNWAHPDRTPVRFLLVVLALFSLLMSSAIPEAFGDKGLQFAAAYVALQLVRSAFMVAAFRGQRMSRNYAQLLVWSATAGVFWVGGAFADGDTRLMLWIVALLLDVGAPSHGFWLPGRGATPMREWTLAGDHLAERFQLVLLIAIGESILALGRTFSGLELEFETTTAFVVGFATAAALWWIYFVGYAEAGARKVADAADPAALGRAGYAYAHAVMIFGVIVVAVGLELTLEHPSGSIPTETALAILGGPGVYLVGTALFKAELWRLVPLVPIAGLGALALLGPLALVVSPLVLGATVTLVLIGLAAIARPPTAAPERDPSK